MKGKPVFFVGLFILLTLAIVSPNLAEAEILPGAIPIQGKLTDPAGIPLNGTFSIIFSLYDVEVGGVAMCTHTRSVTVVGGLFSDYMDGCYFGQLNGQKVYLGIKVEADEADAPAAGHLSCSLCPQSETGGYLCLRSRKCAGQELGH